MLSRDRRLFFIRWLRNPFRVGVPIPSSKGLAHAMVEHLNVAPNDYVVELGPGSGVVTRALLNAGIKEDRLIIIEKDSGFFKQLTKDFPRSYVIQGDACELYDIIKQHNINEVAAVVSSLPLLAMPDKVRRTIVDKAFKSLKSDGKFVQYTYGFFSPIPRKHQKNIGIKGKMTKRVWINFPPARVWRFETHAA